MTNVNHLKKELASFGLAEKQANIYMLLLKQGDLRISEITRTLNIPRSSVYENLRILFARGLAEEIIEHNHKTVRAYPISVLRHQLDEEIALLEKQTDGLKNLEEALSKLPSVISHPPTVIRYYKGKSGARQLLWNTLKATNALYVYSEWGRGRYVGTEFYKSFVAESFARSIEEKVITNSNTRVLDSIRQYTGTPISRANIGRIRTLTDENIMFRGDTFMYDSVYAQVYLKNDEIDGFEIESNQFVDTQRSIFETLWEMATPVSELL